ncbi:MAG: hypothetical protein RR576_09250 [Oscillospiraceae bacterium]
MKQKEDNRCFFAKNIFLAFVLGAVGTFIYLMLINKRAVYYDSAYYWELSQSFFGKDNNFSFLNFPLSWRGYFLPFIFSVCKLGDIVFGADRYVLYVVLSSLNASFICTVALPYLASAIGKQKQVGIIPRIVILVLTLVFWKGLFCYPLSDFYAFSFIVLACALLYSMEEHGNSGNLVFIIKSFFIGVLTYGAYNTRTIYLFSIFAIIILAIITQKQNGLKAILKLFFFALCGFLIAAYPQMLINYNVSGALSIKVDTSMLSGNGLFSDQLFGGLISQRYETLVPGMAEKIGAAGIVYYDSVGQQIMNKLGGFHMGSMMDYFKIIIQYPLETIGIYLRHLINFLNPIFGEMYIEDPEKIKLHYTILNYTLMFATVLGVFGLREKYLNGADNKTKFNWALITKHLAWILPFVLPVLMIIPGQPEVRFFIPVYMLMYMFLACCVDYKTVMETVKKHTVLMAISYVGVFCLLCSVWSMTYTSCNVDLHLFL